MPSRVIIIEQMVDESVKRLGNRRVDPQTGEVYNLEEDQVSPSVAARLVHQKED